MANSNAKQTKVLLLMAGYLLVVISHIVFVQPQKVNGGNLGWSKFLFASKNHNKSGKSIINVKKICKTVVKREFSYKEIMAPATLCTAILFYNEVYSSVTDIKDALYSVQLKQLPVRQSYHLRI